MEDGLNKKDVRKPFKKMEKSNNKKNTAKRNTKPLVYGTADMTSPYQ